MNQIMFFIVEICILPLREFLRIFFAVPIQLFSCFKKKIRCPPIENELLLIPANKLVKMIIRKEIKCEDVISSYINRINTVNPFINAVVEQRFAAALEEAKMYDNFISKTDLNETEIEELYPLLGVPVTVKESVSVKGMSNTAGSMNAQGRKAEEDADAVAKIRKCGAIIMLVSNTPELCLNWETSNNLMGKTCNPYDIRRTSGGSSGGEASLVGSGASLIGIGSDIAGSLRLPAHFCGIYSHKPTAGLVPIKGHFPNCTDTVNWSNCFTLGPMVRYASDLPVMLNLLVKSEERELLKLDEKIPLNKIKFYYLYHNGSLLCRGVDKDIIKSMKNLKNYLKNTHGVSIHKINLNSLRNSSIFSLLELLAIKDVEGPYFDGKHHNLLIELLKYIFWSSKSTLSGILYYLLRKTFHTIVGDSGLEKVHSLNKNFCKDLVNILDDDGILLFPTYPNVAHYHGMAIPSAFDTTFMTIFNAFGLPVTNCPIGYNKDGLPIGIQVIANKYCDRLTLAVAQEIESAYGAWNPNIFNIK